MFKELGVEVGVGFFAIRCGVNDVKIRVSAALLVAFGVQGDSAFEVLHCVDVLEKSVFKVPGRFVNPAELADGGIRLIEFAQCGLRRVVDGLKDLLVSLVVVVRGHDSFSSGGKNDISEGEFAGSQVLVEQMPNELLGVLCLWW